MSETFIKEFHFSEEDMSICDGLIEYHSNNTEYKWAGDTQGAKGGKKSTDVTIHPSSRNPVFLKYRQLLYGYLREYLNTYDNPLNKLRIAEGMNVQHYKPSEGFLSWHCERISQQVHQRALVFMTYLNDVHDGGGTDFKYQGNFCIYCQASASLLSKKMKNKPIKNVKKFLMNSKFFFNNKTFDQKNEWKDFKKIMNKKNIARKNCLLLPIKTLLKALNN